MGREVHDRAQEAPRDPVRSGGAHLCSIVAETQELRDGRDAGRLELRDPPRSAPPLGGNLNTVHAYTQDVESRAGHKRPLDSQPLTQAVRVSNVVGLRRSAELDARGPLVPCTVITAATETRCATWK